MTTSNRFKPLLVTLALVLSTVAMPVGPATAASTTNTHEFTGGGEMLVVDTTNMSGTVTIKWHTQGTPGSGSQVLAETTVDTASSNGAALGNLGAYDSVNATVSGDGTATTAEYGGRIAMPDGYTLVGGTGGDADLTCDLRERIGRAVDSSFTQLDCTAQPGTLSVNTTGTDAQQTKLDIYQSAQNQKASSDNYHTTLDNYLQDTQTQARIIGKNAYIRALNNGSSKAAAKSEAKAAVADYYAVKQQNLVSQYNAQLANYQYLEGVAENESGITQTQPQSGPVPGDFVYPERAHGEGNGYHEQAELTGWQTTTYTTVNGSSIDVTQFRLAHQKYDDTGSYMDTASTKWIGPQSGNYTVVYDMNGVQNNNPTSRDAGWLYVRAPDSNYDTLTAVKPWEYGAKWSEIESQNQQVQNEMDTLANNTYDAYQSGEINNTDLVDPYVLASERSAGNEFQGWANAQLTLLGQNSPENYEEIGGFEVTTESGSSYTGVLHAADNPASGQFEAGQTYDPSQISGSVYLVTPDQMKELNQNFTIQNITTQNGETVQNVTIEKKQYQTTNTTELKQLYEDLAYERAKIEAREQNLRASSGGGLLGGSSGSLVLVLVGVGALYAVSQRRTGGDD